MTMAKYVFAYTGGQMPDTDAEREAVYTAWTQWFGRLGPAVLDRGNPFADSKTVRSGGSINGKGASALGGYSILNADSLAAAAELAKGCPVLTRGGSVEVYEALEM
jgi:hypothetical protein